jgi:hypothetical protein
MNTPHILFGLPKYLLRGIENSGLRFNPERIEALRDCLRNREKYLQGISQKFLTN